jgi:hypothetical protein
MYAYNAIRLRTIRLNPDVVLPFPGSSLWTEICYLIDLQIARSHVHAGYGVTLLCSLILLILQLLDVQYEKAFQQSQESWLVRNKAKPGSQKMYGVTMEKLQHLGNDPPQILRVRTLTSLFKWRSQDGSICLPSQRPST